jgi:serine/threonine-protein kinase
VLRCLAKKPADRFASTNELVDELQRFLEERASAGSVVSDLSAYHRRVLSRAGVLDERRAIREEPAARDGDGPRPPRTAPIRVRAVPLGPTVVGVVAACVGMILGGGVIQWRGGGIRGAKASSTSSVALPAELPPGEVGWLRVNARPWADVMIDGVKMETTPLARALRVRAGRHVVELVHPSVRERRVVDVRVGETTLLDVTLQVPTPIYADEFSETAPSASVAPAPSGKETPFGVPSTLAPDGKGAP